MNKAALAFQWWDLFCLFFIAFKEGFLLSLFFFLDSLFVFFSLPSLYFFLMIFFPFLHSKLFSLPTQSSFSFSFFFPSLAYLSFLILFTNGEYRQDKAICFNFSTMAIKRCTYFLGFPCLICCVFSFFIGWWIHGINIRNMG